MSNYIDVDLHFKENFFVIIFELSLIMRYENKTSSCTTATCWIFRVFLFIDN